MTLFSFSGFHKDKDRRKPNKNPHAASRPSTSSGYPYQNSNVSRVTIHRPIPPPIVVNGSPPNQAWNVSPPHHYQAAMASQPYLPVQPPQVSPPPHSVYGQPYLGANAPWSSSANLSNPVYLSSGGGQSKYQSSSHLPTPATGGHHAASASVSNLSDVWHHSTYHSADGSPSLYDRMSTKLDNVITCMDEETFSGNETDLALLQSSSEFSKSTLNLVQKAGKTNHFKKVWLYSNSRLPPYLPPVKLYLDTYPLLSLAARYSLSVYDKPKGGEKHFHVKESRMNGTKAMVIKSLPIDSMNTIVFAIRGTSTFSDWTVNMKQAPTSAAGFLDDPDNYCHAGFLDVAKAMLPQVAERLRTLLQEDPSRGLASLMITGHSAGGAVAQLLYAHMTSRTVDSELTYLTSFFKRVHCVTFGAPPVSLFPLEHPHGKRHRKSMFFAFANEGDPVVRADTAIVKSLLKLYAIPAPDDPCKIVCPIINAVAPGLVPPRIKQKKSNHKLKASSWSGSSPKPTTTPWKIPTSTLSLGGRIVLLRERYRAKNADDIETCSVTDEMLRDVVYGDPICHSMTLYARRIELLALRAATGQGYG